MAFTSHINAGAITKGQSRGIPNRSTQPSHNYGRVVHVILSLDDPLCFNSSMLNGVYYRPNNILTDESSVSELPFARQGNSNIRLVPLPGEIVYLEKSMSDDSQSSTGIRTTYWTGIVNIWNHPHHGASPDTSQTTWEDSLLGGLPENKTISPLRANPGDLIVEGRLGQSLRLGGYELSTSDSQGYPYIKISNGQIETKSGNSPIDEDINKDFNSIYFLSKHKSDLEPSNTKRDTYKEIPIKSNEYVGNQVIVNAGRIYFNSKEESAFISAKKSIGLNATTVNIDSTDYMCLDAPKMYLGTKALKAGNNAESAVLGHQLSNWLGVLLDSLDSLSDALKIASAVGAGPVSQLNLVAPELKQTISKLKKQIGIFKSKKVYIE